MKNLLVLILGLTMLTACGKQVGKDSPVTPPVITPNPGTATPPSNPSIIYTGQLDFDNHNFIFNQSFFVAPDYTNNHILISETWVTIQDISEEDTDSAESVVVKLYRYSDSAMSTQCTMKLLPNGTYRDSRTTNTNLNYDCQFYVPQGYTIVLEYSDSRSEQIKPVVTRTAIQIVK